MRRRYICQVTELTVIMARKTPPPPAPKRCGPPLYGEAMVGPTRQALHVHADRAPTRLVEGRDGAGFFSSGHRTCAFNVADRVSGLACRRRRCGPLRPRRRYCGERRPGCLRLL